MAEGNETRKRGGRYCVAGAPNDVSCTNSTFTNGIRMHQFPSNPVVRRQWVKFVHHCLDDDEFSYESDIDGDETEDSDESDEEKSESNVK